MTGWSFLSLPRLPATVGQLHLLPRDRVNVLDASLGNFVNSISQWGVGTDKLYTAGNTSSNG